MQLHPLHQAPRNDRASALWLFAATAMFVSLCTGCTRPPEEAVDKPAQVRVYPVHRDQVAPTIKLVGTVIPLDVSRVAASSPGKVMVYPAREGALIEEGDVLAELRSVTLEIEIQAARAQLREKQRRYDELKAGYRNEEIQQAMARKLSAEAKLAFANSRLKRARQLHEQGAVNQEEVDEAVSLAEQGRQALLEAEADYDLMSAGYRSEQIDQAEAALAAGQQEVLRLEDELTKRKILAPFSGYLVEKHTDVGEWVEEGGLVGTLVNLQEVEVVVRVEEQYIGMLREGAEVDVRFDFLPVGQRRFPASIARMVPRAAWQTGSRSFPLHLRVKNRLVDNVPVLKEGMLATVTLSGQGREAMLVHKDAIVRSSGEPVVYVVSGEQRVEPVVITEGLTSGQFVEALQTSLEPGQLLVTEGVERLRPFQAVSIQEDPTESPNPKMQNPVTKAAQPKQENPPQAS